MSSILYCQFLTRAARVLNKKLITMNIITFKSGKSIKVPVEVARVLYDKITTGKCTEMFECFKDQNDKIICIVNVPEIETIHGIENVL